MVNLKYFGRHKLYRENVARIHASLPYTCVDSVPVNFLCRSALLSIESYDGQFEASLAGICDVHSI